MARRSAIGSLSILRLTKRQCACSPFSCCDAVKYATAEQELFDLFRDQLPSVRRDVVVVDTALPLGVAEEEQGRLVMGGDNSAREFSAFDSGVARVGEKIWDYDLVNLTTAAFRSCYGTTWSAFNRQRSSAIAGRPACLGHIDCYNEPIQVAGCTSQHWVRTSCIFLPPLELKILGSLVSIRDPTPWFSGDPSRSVSLGRPTLAGVSPIDHRLAHRSGHRARGEVAFGMALDPTTLPEFERKAQAILNEHLLGLRLRAAGCERSM